MNPAPPNVRYIEESYAETWPTVTQYGSMHFGPVTEGMTVVLPFPLELSRRAIEEQWAWMQDSANKTESHNILLTWHMRLGMERALIAARVKAEVINRVNDAVNLVLIRNAVIRNPNTGR